MSFLYGTTLIGKRYEFSCESLMLKKANELERAGYAVKRAARRGSNGFPLFTVVVAGYKS